VPDVILTARANTVNYPGDEAAAISRDPAGAEPMWPLAPVTNTRMSSSPGMGWYLNFFPNGW
jgi:hypothetical protein